MQVHSKSTPKKDIYQHITDQVIAAIEQGAGPAELPWHRADITTARPVNAFSTDAYQGINIVSLWAAAANKGYASGHWATFNQWRTLGGSVRKGEKGSPIVFYKRYVAGTQASAATRATEDSAVNGNQSVRWFARTSWVFNAQQVDGWSQPKPVVRDPAVTLADAEKFVSATGAVIRRGAGEACYRPQDDLIDMPDREAFKGTTTSTATESYYAVLFHELTHWSGHKTRLARDMAGRFGTQSYAMEELVAELGASFLCAECAITNEPRPDHASYIVSWLEVLKQDTRAIFTAAREASASTTYLLDFRNAVRSDDAMAPAEALS